MPIALLDKMRFTAIALRHFANHHPQHPPGIGIDLHSLAPITATVCLRSRLFGRRKPTAKYWCQILVNVGGHVQIGRNATTTSFPPMAMLAVAGGVALILSSLGLAATGWSMLDFGDDGARTTGAGANLPEAAVPARPSVDEDRVVPFDVFEQFERQDGNAPTTARPDSAKGGKPGAMGTGASRPLGPADADIPRNAEPPSEGRGLAADSDRPASNAPSRPLRAGKIGADQGQDARRLAQRDTRRIAPRNADQLPDGPALGPGGSNRRATPPARPAPMASGGLRVSRRSGVVGFGAGDVLVSRCGADGPEPARVIQEALDAARESGVPACLNVIRGGSAESNVAVRVRPGE